MQGWSVNMHAELGRVEEQLCAGTSHVLLDPTARQCSGQSVQALYVPGIGASAPELLLPRQTIPRQLDANGYLVTHRSRGRSAFVIILDMLLEPQYLLAGASRWSQT